MKIGIFGGRFDPIHIGHLILARDVLEAFALDQIVFLVNYKPPHKPVHASFEHRFNMVHMAIENIPEFNASDIESKLDIEKSYTALVLPHLANLGELLLIIGADQYKEFDMWYSHKKIVEMAKLIVMDRPGVITKGIYDDKILRFTHRRIDISSSEIRERIRTGKPIHYLVPDRVREYILKKKLYLD